MSLSKESNDVSFLVEKMCQCMASYWQEILDANPDRTICIILLTAIFIYLVSVRANCKARWRFEKANLSAPVWEERGERCFVGMSVLRLIIEKQFSMLLSRRGGYSAVPSLMSGLVSAFSLRSAVPKDSVGNRIAVWLFVNDELYF